MSKAITNLRQKRRRRRAGLSAALLCVSLVFGLTTHRLQAAPQPQGYAEVTRHETLIVSAAEGKGLPPIIVAASIMNQGNALTRPFGTDLVERAQLAAPFDFPITGTNSSVGIAQLTPQEMQAYVAGCRNACLFQSYMAVHGMAAKLRAANALLPTDLDPTDRLMVLALAQNTGGSAASAYLAHDGHWRQIYRAALTGYSPGVYNNDQLRKILINVRFLLDNGFELPPGVDLARWERIVNTQGAADRAGWPGGLAFYGKGYR